MERREFLEVSLGLVASTLIKDKPPEKLVYRLIEADKPNKNGRIYPSHVLQNVVETWKNDVSNGDRMLGHFLYVPRDGIILFSKVSHFVKNIELKNGFLQCEIHPLNNPKGEILKKMIKKDEVEFRTAGFGEMTVIDDTTFVIQDGYILNSVDVVKKGTGA